MPPKLLKPTLLTTNQLNQIHAQVIKKPQPEKILNPLLKRLAHSPTPTNAILLYNQMLHHPTCHNHYTFTHALKACSLAQASFKGLEIHAFVMKMGHSFDVFIQNSLLQFYLVENDVFTALQVFNSIVLPDVVSWTTIISGLCKSGFDREAFEKFLSMDVMPNVNTLVTVMSACTNLGAVGLGKAIHAYGLRNFCNEHNIIWDNALLEFYLRCGSCLETVNFLFVNMPERDVVSWTTMVGGYAQRGLCEEAVRIFQEMVQRREAVPNELTLVNVLAACASIGRLSLGQDVHSYINATRPDLMANHAVCNALINMYAKCGNVDVAIQVFKMVAFKDVISWSTIVSGLAMNGCGKQALQLFSLMLVNGVAPDDVTFVGLLSACSHAGLVQEGLMFFKAMKSVCKIEPQMQHLTCIVDMYGRAGLLDKAEEFIRATQVEAQGQVWGVLLNACKVHGNEEMFERIRQSLVDSRGVSTGTYALLSNTFAGANRWVDAYKVRHEMVHKGLKKMAGCSRIEVD